MIKEYYDDLCRRLSQCGSDCADYEARLMLEDIAGITWADIIINQAADPTSDQQEKIDNILKQRKQGKPLSRILGVRQFWGLDFNLNEHTLDPRPDTEVLVEKALDCVRDQQISSPNILDLGTGTGCIIISLLSELKNATGLAVDLEPKALEMAHQNAQKHGVDGRLIYQESNWFSQIQPKQYDLIVSNPPYIDPEVILSLDENVKNHDPILALDGGKNGIKPYEIIFSSIKNYLTPAGRAFLEIGYDQCGYIQGIADKYRIRICDIHLDYAGNPRVVEISCGDK